MKIRYTIKNLVDNNSQERREVKFSTRGQYGTRALLDLALHSEEAPVLLKDIAQRQQISLPYLEHLVTRLTAGGIVRSMRGPRGGHRLADKQRSKS